MSLPSFYQIDFSTGNGHLLANELRRIATGKSTLTETSARVAMLHEFQDLGTALGFSKNAYMMTNILSGAIWELVNSQDIDIKTLTDLELQQHLLRIFEIAVGRFVASNPDSAPEQAYHWYVTQRQTVIAKAQYELSKLSLRKTPPKMLPEVVKTDGNPRASLHDFEEIQILCQCGEKGFPCIRTGGHGGWTDGVLHLDDTKSSGLAYHVMRPITDEVEAKSLKAKYPNMKSVLHVYRGLLNNKSTAPKPTASKPVADNATTCPAIGCGLTGSLRVRKLGGLYVEAFHHYNPDRHRYTYHAERSISKEEYDRRVPSQSLISPRIPRPDKNKAEPEPFDTVPPCPDCGRDDPILASKRFRKTTNEWVQRLRCRGCGKQFTPNRLPRGGHRKTIPVPA